MKFTEICGGENAARICGYTFDGNADKERDDALYHKLMAERGPRFVDRKAEQLWDLDGSLYRGDDGNYYAVVKVFSDSEYRPLFWHRLAKEL